MMKNLSKVFGLVLMVAILMFGGNNAKAQFTEIEIDSTFVDADTTLHVDDTVFTYVESNYILCGVVDTIYSDSIRLKYVLYKDHFSSIWYVNSTEGEYDWTSKTHIYNPYNYEFVISYPEFTFPIDNTESDIFLHVNGTTEDFYIHLTFNHTATTGINDLFTETDKNDITLYPNPVVNTLSISGNFEQATIFDMSGKMVLSTTESNINMSEFKNGVYIVNVDGVSKRIIKQ